MLGRIVREYRPNISIDLLDKLEYNRILRNSELLGHEIESSLKEAGEQPLLVFIDEVQRVPSLLNDVHRFIERFKGKVFFILTGSSARKLKDDEANLLAGRALRIYFFPLGIDEFDVTRELDNALQFGCLPGIFHENNLEIKSLFLKTYVGTYLQEEIQRESRIRNMEGFARFLEFAAVENGTIVNYENIAKFAGIADTTVKAYYQLLIDTLVAYEIPAWHNSLRKQIQKGSRYYLFDNGVVNALTGELLTELKPSTYRFGRLFESFIIQQIRQALEKSSSPLKCFHYREYSGLEVDLILQKNPHSPPLAVEINSGSAPGVKDVKNLLSFKKQFPECTPVVICQTPREYEMEGLRFLGIEGGLNFIKSFNL
jgi:uncharacterized protein